MKRLLITAILSQFFLHIMAMQPFTDTTFNPYGLNIINTPLEYHQAVIQNKDNQLVDIKRNIPQLHINLPYCTDQNFTGIVLYPPLQTSYLRRPVAEALKKITEELEKEGLGLKIWDAYRPYQVTQQMWKVVPDARYAADPAVGSGHNRGIAVDLTLIEKQSGKELDMGTEFDNFTEKAHHDYVAFLPEVLAHRQKLKKLMEAHGFKALPTEWWHYAWASGEFELMDFSFNILRELCEGAAHDNPKNHLH